MEFRKLVEDDAAAYWAVRLEAVENEPLAFGLYPEEHRRVPLDAVCAMIGGEGTFLFGAFDSSGQDSEALVGIARFAREPAAKERHKAYVHGVYLAPSHRGRGVARAMIAALIAMARQEVGLEQLLLRVGTHNTRARALYAEMGFVGCGIEPRSMKVDAGKGNAGTVGERYVDEEQMILLLG